MVVLAGGMATRMGGIVKALAEAVPGVTFLDARLAEREYWADRAGAPLPMWLMTSHATDAPIRAALGERLDGDRVAAFPQQASLRLTPQGRLFRGDDGEVSLHATGHGDLPDALHQSGLLELFLAAGGRYLWIANLDNLGAAVDPLVLGWHVDHGAPLTVEVVDKQGGDRGGIPVRLDGRPVVLENFRLPDGFDEDEVRVFNTNTFIADAAALAGLQMPWTWFRVEKTVDGRSAIQFERLIGELTSQLTAASCGCRARATARASCRPRTGTSWSKPAPDRRAHRAVFVARSRPSVAPPSPAACLALPGGLADRPAGAAPLCALPRARPAAVPPLPGRAAAARRGRVCPLRRAVGAAGEGLRGLPRPPARLQLGRRGAALRRRRPRSGARLQGGRVAGSGSAGQRADMAGGAGARG